MSVDRPVASISVEHVTQVIEDGTYVAVNGIKTPCVDPATKLRPGAVVIVSRSFPSFLTYEVDSFVRKAFCLQLSLQTFHAASWSPGVLSSRGWMSPCGLVRRSLCTGRRSGVSILMSSNIGYQGWDGHTGDIRIISEEWRFSFFRTSPRRQKGGKAYGSMLSHGCWRASVAKESGPS